METLNLSYAKINRFKVIRMCKHNIKYIVMQRKKEEDESATGYINRKNWWRKFFFKRPIEIDDQSIEKIKIKLDKFALSKKIPVLFHRSHYGYRTLIVCKRLLNLAQNTKTKYITISAQDLHLLLGNAL